MKREHRSAGYAGYARGSCGRLRGVLPALAPWAALALLAAGGCDDGSAPAANGGASDLGVDGSPDGPEDTTPSDVDAADLPPLEDAADDPKDPDGDTDGPCEHCFGWPCEDNADCFSGFCLDGPDGRACTRTCSADCPPGFGCKPVGGAGGDPTFICVYDHVRYCRPCDQDGDCAHPLVPGQDNRCVPSEDGSGSFCATRCAADDACPGGASCLDVTLGDEVASLCRPDDGVCTCSPRDVEEGASTACAVANEFGSCEGRRSCAEGGLTACDAPTPAEEICNDVDDDCDGLTDEGFEQIGEPCDGDDEDACEDGVWACESTGLVCIEDGESKVEACNGVDDDCDGRTDEDFAQGGEHTFTDADGTGGLVLGDSCGAGACAGGEVICSSDGASMACSSAQDGASERCNGKDDDCDGQTDEAFMAGGDQIYVSPEGDEIPLGGSCGLGACAGGEVVCGPGGSVVCDSAGLADTESCNGLDDDCDGQTDEAYKAGGKFTFTDRDGTTDLVLGDPCGAGACEGGAVTCDPSGPGLVCDGHDAIADEACNGLDDDCDGAVDEDLFLSHDTSALEAAGCNVEGVCGLPGATTATCEAGGWVCTTEHELYEEDETLCDNKDNDCDGELDELPPVMDSETLAELGCATEGVCGSPGSTSATCTNGVWGCSYNHPAWQPTETLCDGFDNDCDGQTDPDGIEQCQDVWADTDGDGFGDPDQPACKCFPGEGWADNDDDCYDGSADVSPDHTAWEPQPHGGGDFDWDCNNKEDKRWTQSVGKCAGDVKVGVDGGLTIDTCVPEFGSTSGWRGSAPACGVQHDWHEASDCELVFGLMLESEIGDDEVGACEFGFCLAACVWEDATARTQECR